MKNEIIFMQDDRQASQRLHLLKVYRFFCRPALCMAAKTRLLPE